MGRSGCVAVLGALYAATVSGQPFSMDIQAIPGRPARPTKQPCDSTIVPEIRWSGTSVRIYLEHTDGTEGGCATLTSIRAALAADVDALTLVDAATKTWELRADLFVQSGVTLQLYGGNDGDVNELRFYSAPGEFYNLRGYGGNIDIMDTHIFGADSSGNPQTDYESGRSYISCITEYNRGDDCTKTDPIQGFCRMDIVMSEIDHLGWFDSESYGLTWKARGLCTEEGLRNLDMFDTVAVTGDMTGSNIHNLYYGMYSYGHQGGIFNNNEMHDNIQYGFDPHDDSDWMTFHNNLVYNNGNHGIIASQRCNHVSIQNNEVYGGDQAGIFLHRSSNFAVVRGNYAHDNADAGLAVMESMSLDVNNNRFEDNYYGIRLSVGSSDNTFSDNTVSGSTQYNIYSYEGSDELQAADTKRMQNNEFEGNTVAGPSSESIKWQYADNTVFDSNTFEGAQEWRFVDSDETSFVGNTYTASSVDLTVESGTCFTSASQLTPSC